MTKTTVTVAVSAYNEARNIAAFLNSVLAQREEGFVIEKILIISDGSTDETAARVRAFNSQKVELREYADRLGKSSRLNEIYAHLSSDILVQSDADVIFAHNRVIRDLITPLLLPGQVAMCGGRPVPVPGQTFTERAVNLTAQVYDQFRSLVRGGNNIFSADGRLLAFKRELVKKITVPADMIANDAFTYFCCLQAGYRYQFVPTAIVNFRSPQTLRDQVRQNTRFAAARTRMIKYFGMPLVSTEYYIPTALYYRGVAGQFLRHPLLCGYVFAINLYCKFRSRLAEKRLTAKWDLVQTTKHV